MQVADKLLYRPEEVAERLSISRWAVYRAIGDGSLESVKIGKSRRISSAAVASYIERLCEEQATPA
jgi:excisionase family DNA binding protein